MRTAPVSRHMAPSTRSRTNHQKYRTGRNRETDVRLTRLIRTIYRDTRSFHAPLVRTAVLPKPKQGFISKFISKYHSSSGTSISTISLQIKITSVEHAINHVQIWIVAEKYAVRRGFTYEYRLVGIGTRAGEVDDSGADVDSLVRKVRSLRI